MISRFPRLLALLSPAVVLAAGCGGGNYSASPTNGTFSITPATTAVSTNAQVQLTAKLNSGSAANVHWALVNGQNDSQIGQGTIDQNGLYTPPAALSRDSVQVQVQANLTNNIYTTATAVITVTPGFNQPIAPETAALTSNGSLTFTGVIAEVGSGSLQWNLSSSNQKISNPGSGYGSISHQSCQRSSQSYTTCTATYTAPSGSLPTAPLYLAASAGNNGASVSYAKLILNNAGINSSPLTNQAGQNGVVQMGTSGGNNNDYDTDSTGQYVVDCASGTLGALLADQNNTQYILSNNHVLAEADQGTTTDSIIQPGLVDTGCQPLVQGSTGIRSVGTLSYSVPLNNAVTNVDAALATAANGTVDSSGAILGLGPLGANGQPAAAAPAGGMGEPLTAENLASGGRAIQVVKSGRTTGLTCSTIDSIADTFQVDYYKDAAGTQFYTTKTFTNQIGISGGYFSDFGDSGSLIVDASNAQPVGLFFAGSSDGSGQGQSFASPIADVLGELSTETSANSSLRFHVVGGAEHPVTCLNYDTNTAAPSTAAVSKSELARAAAVTQRQAAALVNPQSGIFGVAAGKSLDHPGRAAVLVYTDSSKGAAAVPATIGGLRTVVIPTTAARVAAGSAPVALKPSAGIHLTQAALRSAVATHKQYAAQLMAEEPAYFGVGVGESLDRPGEPALLVFVDANKTPRFQPATLGGLRVRYMRLKRIKITLGRRSASAVSHQN